MGTMILHDLSNNTTCQFTASTKVNLWQLPSTIWMVKAFEFKTSVLITVMVTQTPTIVNPTATLRVISPTSRSKATWANSNTLNSTSVILTVTKMKIAGRDQNRTTALKSPRHGTQPSKLSHNKLTFCGRIVGNV